MKQTICQCCGRPIGSECPTPQFCPHELVSIWADKSTNVAPQTTGAEISHSEPPKLETSQDDAGAERDEAILLLRELVNAPKWRDFTALLEQTERFLARLDAKKIS